MNNSVRDGIMEELKTLDEPEILFVSAFSKAFDNELQGVYLGLEHLKKINLSKDSLDCWKENELLGKLMGETTYLHIKSSQVTKKVKND